MTIEAIIYKMPPGSIPVAQAIRIDHSNSSIDLLGVELPAVLVMKEQDVLDHDRLFLMKSQHTDKDLASYFIGRKQNSNDKMHVILRGKYKKAGKLSNAIQKFLERVKQSHEKKPYFICIDDKFFESLKDASLSESLSTDIVAEPYFQENNPPIAVELPKEEENAREILELMKGDEELIDDRKIRNTFRGDSYSCRLVRQRIMKTEGNTSSVLIEGERGTGKELVAQAIHEIRKKNKKLKFVSLNCSAIPNDMLETELFGYKKGAFTGADKDKDGLWKIAGDGTLFLDEIGELAPNHQAKILRALETKRIRPVGATEDEPVSACIVAATNRNLNEKNKYGKHLFRQDLYDRLKQIPIKTPILNWHPEDIPEYADSIWKEITKDDAAYLPHNLMDVLMNLNWEDNVRGLRNVLEDLHNLYPKNPTVEKLNRLLQYRKNSEENVITHEKVTSIELNDMIEILAKASHSTWYRKRESEGWTWGPKRIETDQIKTNPDMKPYNELTDEQKSYAREEARSILKAILNEGYSITK
ncbi:MAG: sigma 54-interacting transcriptional regulator [Bacteroidales bacterium]